MGSRRETLSTRATKGFQALQYVSGFYRSATCCCCICADVCCADDYGLIVIEVKQYIYIGCYSLHLCLSSYKD